MFWDDTTTPWEASTEFPNISVAKALSIRTVTYDPGLYKHGPGYVRGIGHIVGVTIGADNDGMWYFPMRHTSGNNLNPESVLTWLRSSLGDKSQPKVGANIGYDVGWLQHENVNVKGDLVDIQFAESILSETHDLNSISIFEKYINTFDRSKIMYGSNTYSNKSNIFCNVHNLSPNIVGRCEEYRSTFPIKVIKNQYVLLQNERLINVFEMECRLIRLMLSMATNGVRVDVVNAIKIRDKLKKYEKVLNKRIQFILGFNINVNSSTQISKAFEKLDIPYNYNVLQNPIFNKTFLSKVNHPLSKLILEKRRVLNLRKTFLENYILDTNLNGTIYCQYHQLRENFNGTSTGRFSSSKINLQNIPNDPLIRGLFIPDIGHKRWIKKDYSQIEYRFLSHFAVGKGSIELLYNYNCNPNADYHTITQNMIFNKTGKKIGRNQTKAINLGLIYGMGSIKLSEILGLSRLQGDNLYKVFHESFPFIFATMRMAITEHKKTGKIKTILGRISRLNVSEQKGYIALNRKLQGSSADLIKLAMLKCYDNGLFDITGVPKLTIHDELDFSDPGFCDDAFREITNTMETCIPLKVPVIVNVKAGPNWGTLKDINL